MFIWYFSTTVIATYEELCIEFSSISTQRKKCLLTSIEKKKWKYKYLYITQKDSKYFEFFIEYTKC